MWNFIKKYGFFMISKEGKKYIKNTIMVEDNKGLSIVMTSIMCFQLAMIVLNFIRYGFNINDYAMKVKGYLICYVCLAAYMIIAQIVTKILYKRKLQSLYFVNVATIMTILIIWGISVTAFDSMERSNLTTFAYVTIATCSFILLEPWIMISLLIILTILLNVTFAVSPLLYYSNGVIVNSLSILALAIMVTLFNFYRRVRAIELEKEVNDLNKVLTNKAFIDDLTKINNRRYLTEHIEDALTLGANPSGIMLFDIDDFKKINDTYGHQNGDICLSILGDYINQLVSKKPNSYAVRYGGEEFLIYFKSISKEELYEVADDFRKSIETNKVKLLDSSYISFTISIGTASASSNISYSGLINEADNNLYKAKEAGKNIVCETK